MNRRQSPSTRAALRGAATEAHRTDDLRLLDLFFLLNDAKAAIFSQSDHKASKLLVGDTTLELAV
jgi:hypothetical protein